MPLHVYNLQYYFTINLFILFSTNIYLSTGNNAYYTICKNNPFSCGNITNLGYPFWGDNRPQFCGHRNFGLSCQNGPIGVPFIYRMGKTNGAESLSARVVSINTYSHTMSLVQNPFCYNITPISCQSLIRNETITKLSKPFKFSPLVANIGLFLSCGSSVANYSARLKILTCDGVNNTADSAYYVDKSEDEANISKLCSTKRVFPVLKSELDELKKGKESLTGVLNKGFDVEYTVDFNGCLSCQNSGGVCGSSDDSEMRFSCYCPDGMHTSLGVCHIPDAQIPVKANARRIKLAIIGSGAFALTILVLVLLIICSKKGLLPEKYTSSLDIRGIKENQNAEAFLKAYGSLAPKRYKYADIKKIAISFKEKLGEGGFGCVYKGKLQDGRFVAVKLLNKIKGNGDDFINEVLSISRTNHVNVVSLLGFCLEGNKRALIYEYLVNGSLDKFMNGRDTHPSLRWETMFKIAVGIARGINYLHRGCNARILHLDIKPHNVLLDEEFCPKISDFGLAKLCSTKDNTISILEARGTIGYIAPEVVFRSIGGVSHKSDVYSYGMMVLNMACGRSNLSPEVQRSSEQYFPEWIFNQLEHTEQASQATLQAMINEEEKEVQRKMILVGLWCIQTYPSHRPSMDRVLEMIEGPLESLPMPPRAAAVYN